MSRLKFLDLEGDENYENSHKDIVHIFKQSRNVVELFMHFFPKVEFDGAEKIIIYFINKPENEKKYELDNDFHFSTYYVDDEIVEKSRKLDVNSKDNFFLQIIEDVLCDIASKTSRKDDLVRLVKEAAYKVRECNFDLVEKIDKFSKFSGDRKYKAIFYRKIDTNGEFSYVEVWEKKNLVMCIDVTDKQDIPVQFRFHHCMWDGYIYNLYDRFDKLVTSIDAEKQELLVKFYN